MGNLDVTVKAGDFVRNGLFKPVDDTVGNNQCRQADRKAEHCHDPGNRGKTASPERSEMPLGNNKRKFHEFSTKLIIEITGGLNP